MPEADARPGPVDAALDVLPDAPRGASRRSLLAAAAAGLAVGAGALVPQARSAVASLADLAPAVSTSVLGGGAGAAATAASTTTTATTGATAASAAATATATARAVAAAADTATATATATDTATATAATATTAAPAATAAPSLAAASTGATAPAGTTAAATAPGPTAAGTTSAGTAAAGTAGTTTGSAPAPVLAPGPVPGGDVHHLLRRATYGPTPASLAAAQAQGRDAWLAAQLDPASVPDPVGDAIDAAHPGIFLSTTDARAYYAEEFWRTTHEVVRWRVARSVWSTRQLHEVMSDLMHNHLNVPIGAEGPSGYALHRYHHDVVRAHALGSFADMLVASAEHPAMLHYLNASTSTRTAPNENYARELMELHTVGVGTHTEADVKAAALLLTGWRTRWPWEGGGEPYTAWFDPSRHHVGPLTVLGRAYPNGSSDGRATIRTFLADLARHPATAAHLARRLARHFVADDPPADLVASLAQVYLANGTRLGPVLRALFTSRAFEDARGTKVRRPLERYLATVRLVAPAPAAPDALAHDGLVWLLPSQRPLSWPAPDGYPDVAARWESAGVALTGLGTASDLVEGWVPVVGRQLTGAVLAGPATDVEGITDDLCRRLLLRPAQPTETEAARRLLARSALPPGPWRTGSWDRYRAVWFVAVLLLAHPLLLDR